MASNYAALCIDPRWQKKRLEIMERDNFTCRSCGDKKTTLNVHHAYYEKGKKPWEYPNRSLVILCEKCHKKRHEMQKEILCSINALDEDEYFGLYHMLPIAGAERFLGLIGTNVLAAEDTFIDYDGMANMIPILAEAYSSGKEDAS